MRGCAAALTALLAVEGCIGMANMQISVIFGVCFQRGFIAAWANWLGQNMTLPFVSESEADGR